MSRDWAEATLGDIATLEYGKPLKAEDRDGDGFPVYGSAGKVGLHSKPMINCAPVIVVGRKGTAGAVWWSDLPCSVIDTAFYVVPKVHINLRFLYLLLKDLDLSSLTAQTGVPGLNRDRAYSSVVKLPSAEEQARIVDLVAAVDEYIVELEGQTGAVRTARNAVLHELLFAGGDDWTETTLGEVVLVVNGSTPSTKNAEYWNGDIPWITTTELTYCDDGFVSSSTRKISSAAVESGGAKLVRSGVTLLGTTATIGTVALAMVDTCFNQQISGLVPRSQKILDKFLFVWTRGNRFQLEEMAAGTSFKRISTVNLKKLKFLLPPVNEQKRIVEIVSSMDEVIQSTEQAVVDAKNLRSGLLSDLLSGVHEIPDSYDRLLGVA